MAAREVVGTEERGISSISCLIARQPPSKVQSPYTSPLQQRPSEKPVPLWIRIPLWVKRNDLVISGAAASPEFVNGYLFMAEPPASLVTVDFPPVQEELVSTYLRRIRARLQGKQVLQMENFGADRTFFDALT